MCATDWSGPSRNQERFVTWELWICIGMQPVSTPWVRGPVKVCRRCLQVDYYSWCICGRMVCLNALRWRLFVSPFNKMPLMKTQIACSAFSADDSYKWTCVWSLHNSLCVHGFGSVDPPIQVYFSGSVVTHSVPGSWVREQECTFFI